MKQRIIGIDVARALAVIGMIIVNFKIVFGQEGTPWLKAFAHLFDGKAAATFVVLAGIGLALMTKSAHRDSDLVKFQKARKRIINRAMALFVIGLSYIWIWPADILHFYGIYMLGTLMVITRRPPFLLWTTAALILLFPVLLVFFDYEAGWDFSTLEYSGFWTPAGFFRNLFFNGFHPVIPWTAFMIFGLWYGRQDLHNDRFVRRSLGISSLVFVTIQMLSTGTPEERSLFLGTDPMPPLPLYMLNGISISVVIISGCILIAKKFPNWKLTQALKKTGQLALTFYVAHVVIGMGVVEVFGSKAYGAYSIQFSIIYALIFSLVCILFAEIWLKYKQSGPLEWLLRKITG